MVLVKCPHCGKSHRLWKNDYKQLSLGGKRVRECNKCKRLFVIEEDFDGEDTNYFTH